MEGKTSLVKAGASGGCSSKTSPHPIEPNLGEFDPFLTESVTDTYSTHTSQCATARQPCKPLTLLSENLSADITQVPLSTQPSDLSSSTSKPDGSSAEGVECGTAYRMLMQYATSVEKMDKIAAALEGGCEKSATAGCRMDKSVVWKCWMKSVHALVSFGRR
jgi:hypothetical protein